MNAPTVRVTCPGCLREETSPDRITIVSGPLATTWQLHCPCGHIRIGGCSPPSAARLLNAGARHQIYGDWDDALTTLLEDGR